jgi:prophage regulatory protein
MRYIRFKELRSLIPLGRTTIWRMMRDGRFPQSRRIGKMATAWLESEVEEWIRQRAQEGGRTETLRNRRAGYEQI